MRFKTLLIQDHQEVGFTGKTKFEAKHRVLPPRSLNHLPFVIGIALLLFNNMMGTDHRIIQVSHAAKEIVLFVYYDRSIDGAQVRLRGSLKLFIRLFLELNDVIKKIR